MKKFPLKLNVLLIALLGVTLLLSCKKEKKQIDEFIGSNSGLKTSIDDLDRYATYNSTYDVLVFEHFEDVATLEQELFSYSQTYPYNQGNTVSIFQKFDDIKTYGFTDRVPPTNGQINIDDFEELLLDSYPLSDSVLLALIELNEQISPRFPDAFLESVLTANVPFAYEVSDSIKNAQIPTLTKDAIMAAHDDVYIIPDLAYDDFLSFYPSFNSFYEELNTEEETKLRGGAIPGAPGFFPDDFDNRFLSLVLNDAKEIFVEGHLIKFYNNCRTVVMHNTIANAYTELALLNPEGLATPPTNVSETTAGLTISVMNGYFPTDYAIIDLNNIDFDPNNTNDPIGLNSYDSYDVLGCPQSSFSYGWESGDDFDVTFTNLTNLFFPGNTIYHYWQFGDGSGSFQESPHHIYTNPGTYNVRLTTFTEDCGCWDVQSFDVVIPDPIVVGTKACYCNVDVNVQGILDETNIVEFSANAFDDVDPLAVGVEYHWFFGDGTWNVTSTPDVSHYYPYSGNYTVELFVKLSNDCTTNLIEFNVNIPNDDPDICCDKRQNMPSQTWTFSYNGTNNHKLKTNDSYTGNDLFDDKIHGCQKLYRKKANDKWTGQKGRHYINVDAEVYYKNLTTGQKCATVGIIIDGDNTTNHGIYGSDKQAFDFPCWQDPFGVLESNTIEIYHRVYVSYPYGYFEKTIIMGEQNCD